jgi:hypothetical protein
MKQHKNIIKASIKGHRRIISVWVHPELENIMKQAANRRNVPVSRLYRAAIESYSETLL